MRFLAISAVIGAVTLGSVWAMDACASARGTGTAPHAIAATATAHPKASAAPMDKKDKATTDKMRKDTGKPHSTKSAAPPKGM